MRGSRTTSGPHSTFHLVFIEVHNLCATFPFIFVLLLYVTCCGVFWIPRQDLASLFWQSLWGLRENKIKINPWCDIVMHLMFNQLQLALHVLYIRWEVLLSIGLGCDFTHLIASSGEGKQIPRRQQKIGKMSRYQVSMLSFLFNFELFWGAGLYKMLGGNVGNPESLSLQECPGSIHNKLGVRCVGDNFRVKA